MIQLILTLGPTVLVSGAVAWAASFNNRKVRTPR